MSPYLNHDNVRTPEQQALMEKIEKDGVCPFCKEHFETYHPKPLLKETPFWYVTENMSPYEGTKHHFIFVYRPEHVSSLSDVTPEAAADLFKLITDMTTEYAIPGGSFFMRFGDTRYTGSSVEHLHAHLLMGDADAADHQPVRVKLG